MRAWWLGTRLVAGRALLEHLRSRSFKIVTALLLLLSAAAVTLPQLLTGDATRYTLATVDDAPPELVAALDAVAAVSEFDIDYLSRQSQEQVRTAVRDGDATVGLAGNILYVPPAGAGTFPVVVAQTVVTLETSRRLTAAGLSPDQVAALQAIRGPDQVTVGGVADEGRAAVGFTLGIVLYLALTVGGTAIATAVATEKSTRISEVLLAVLRPSQILVGTVLAVGTATFLQLLVLGAPLAVAVQVTDEIGLPAVAGTDITLAVAWFVLGFALYAFLYAASGALVDKITELNTAIIPVTMVLVGGYFLTIFTVMDGPASPWSVVVSIFPFTAPLAMPLRWASGEVPAYQLGLAMLLTAGSAVALVWLSSVIYRRALIITGRRVRFREVIGRETSTALDAGGG